MTLPSTSVRLAHTPAEVAALLGISRSHAYKLLRTGELLSVKLGGRPRRIRHADLVRFLDGLALDAARHAAVVASDRETAEFRKASAAAWERETADYLEAASKAASEREHAAFLDAARDPEDIGVADYARQADASRSEREHAAFLDVARRTPNERTTV